MSAEEIEEALITLADLYANSSETGEYLSTSQQAIAAKVMHLSIASQLHE